MNPYTSVHLHTWTKGVLHVKMQIFNKEENAFARKTLRSTFFPLSMAGGGMKVASQLRYTGMSSGSDTTGCMVQCVLQIHSFHFQGKRERERKKDQLLKIERWHTNKRNNNQEKNALLFSTIIESWDWGQGG